MTSVPKTMHGLQIKQFNADPPYELREDIPVPKIGPKDILLKIETAGYCHTEMMVARGEFKDMMRGSLPLVPSHEPTGVIAALGDEVAAASSNSPGTGGQGPFEVGDRVGALAFKDFCGQCEDCKRGDPKFCDNQDMCGVTADGAFAEYMAADYRSCVRLPDSLAFDAAAPLFCAGATIYTAIKGCNLKSGDSLAIIGAGALGHLGVQFAKCLGLRVVCVDSRDPPLELVKGLKYPPDAVLNTSSIDVEDPSSIKAGISKIGGPVDACIVATDAIPAFTFGLELVRKHGLLMVVGQPNTPIPIPFVHLIFRDITVKGSLLGDPATVKEMVDLVGEKGIEVKTEAYPLEKIEQLMEDYAKPGHKGKLVVRVAK